MTERSVLKFALKRPHAVLSVGHVAGTLRRSSGLAFVSLVLVAPLVLLHVLAGDAAARRDLELIGELTAAQLIDARWNAAALRPRVDTAASAPAVPDADVARAERPREAKANSDETAHIVSAHRRSERI